MPPALQAKLPRAQSPPLREMYDLAAVAWSNSDVALTRRELALLDEGLRFFPRDSDLHYKAAVVNAVQGYRAETTALVPTVTPESTGIAISGGF